jgi:hypothetical protein
MSDLLQEVDNAMRVEKMKALWSEYKIVLIAGISALILGTAFFSIYFSWQKSQNEQATAKLYALIQTPDAAKKLAELATEKSGDAKTLALINLAARAVEAKNYEQALTTYQDIMKDRLADATFSQLASLQYAKIALDHKKEWTGDDVLPLLQKTMADKKSPWRFEAGLVGALIQKHKQNKVSEAISTLNTLLKMQGLPESIKEKASGLVRVYAQNSAGVADDKK